MFYIQVLKPRIWVYDTWFSRAGLLAVYKNLPNPIYSWLQFLFIAALARKDSTSNINSRIDNEPYFFSDYTLSGDQKRLLFRDEIARVIKDLNARLPLLNIKGSDLDFSNLFENTNIATEEVESEFFDDLRNTYVNGYHVQELYGTFPETTNYGMSNPLDKDFD